MTHTRLTAADHRRAWSLAWPMIVGGISSPLLGMVDTAVMGHLDSPVYLGAVALGAMIFHFLFWGLGFLRMGTTGLAAHAYGSGTGQALYDVLGRAVLIALILAALLLLFQRPIEWLAFRWVAAGQEMLHEARLYYGIRIWSAPAILVNYIVIGWFLGLQRPHVPLILMLLMNAVNIVLDLYLVVELDMRTEGVAWASVITEYLGLVCGLWFVHWELGRHRGHWNRAHILNRDALRRTLAINKDIFIRTIVLISAFALFTLQGAKMGDTILAANAVLINFMHFMAYGLDGFAHTAEALVGESLGRRDRQGLRRSLKVTAIWSALVALGFSFAYAVAGMLIIRELTDIEMLRSLAQTYLPWLVVMPLVGVWAYWLDGVFIGATQARRLRNAMLAAFALVYLPTLWLFQDWGNHGLWLALLMFMLARAVFLAPGLRRLDDVIAQTD